MRSNYLKEAEAKDLPKCPVSNQNLMGDIDSGIFFRVTCQRSCILMWFADSFSQFIICFFL